MGNEIEATPIYPGKLYPQQNKSSYTAGKKARMMRLICKIKENDRRGISNHDTISMSGPIVDCLPLLTMAPTLAPSVVTPVTAPQCTPVTDLAQVLYIH